MGLFGRTLEHAQSVDGGSDHLKPSWFAGRHRPHLTSNIDPLVLTRLRGVPQKRASFITTADVVCLVD